MFLRVALVLFTLPIVLGLSGCASRSKTVEEPHVYQVNSIVVNADDSLASEFVAFIQEKLNLAVKMTERPVAADVVSVAVLLSNYRSSDSDNGTVASADVSVEVTDETSKLAIYSYHFKQDSFSNRKAAVAQALLQDIAAKLRFDLALAAPPPKHIVARPRIEPGVTEKMPLVIGPNADLFLNATTKLEADGKISFPVEPLSPAVVHSENVVEQDSQGAEVVPTGGDDGLDAGEQAFAEPCVVTVQKDCSKPTPLQTSFIEAFELRK